MDKLPNLILAFGQVKAATRLTGMELRQFTEAGVPLLDELAKVMGKPVSEIQKMISAGEVGFPIVQQALQNLTGEGGRFNDLMTKQSQSLGGMWSNLQDAWDMFLRGQGAQLLDWGKQFVAFLIELTQNQLPRAIQIIQQTTEWFMNHKEAIIIVAGVIIGALIPALISLIITLAAGLVALAPYMLGGLAIAGIVAGIYWIIKHWDILKDSASTTMAAILGFFYDGLESVKGFFTDAIDWISDKLATIINLVDRVKSAASSVGGFVSGTASKIGGILGFAEGGIVTQPTLAMVGEAGPEAIIPLSKAGTMGLTINITGNSFMGEEGIAEKIGNQIMQAIKANIRL